jgi:hypothetical protein
MAVLCKKAKELKGTFLTFQINHVLRVSPAAFSIVVLPFVFQLYGVPMSFCYSVFNDVAQRQLMYFGHEYFFGQSCHR